MKKHFCKCNAL